MKNKWSEKNKIWILLGLIVLFGFILRIYALGHPAMWIDETISSLVMKNILEKGVPVFDSGLFYSRALVFHYIGGGFLFLFGGDFGARFFSVLCGLGTIVLAFFIAREFSWKKGKNEISGLVAALFTAVLFIEIIYSRQARFYQLFQFLFFLTIFFLYKSKKEKNYLWFSVVSFILLIDTHIAGFVLFPFVFYVFAFENKNWKLFIVPLVAGIYYLRSLVGLVNEIDVDLVLRYAGNYYSGLTFYMGVFLIFSLIGIVPAFKWNKRLTWLVVLPTLILFFGVFFMKLYGLRYVYFVFLLVPIFIGVLFSFIYRERKILFIILLIFSVIYPSNLIFPQSRMISVLPNELNFESMSEPVLDYKMISEETKQKILDSEIVTLFTPGVEWYFKKPNYFIPFSLSGLPEGYMLFEGRDSYTGVVEFDWQINEFVFILDEFSYSKLNELEKEKVDEILEHCELIESKDIVGIYSCDERT